MIKSKQLKEAQRAPSAHVVMSSRQKQAVAYQVIAVLLVIFAIFYFTTNMFDNIDKRGITTGFGFLSDTAGFGISQTLIAYSDSTSNYLDVFIIGVMNTALVSIVCIVFASILGLLIGIGR